MSPIRTLALIALLPLGACEPADTSSLSQGPTSVASTATSVAQPGLPPADHCLIQVDGRVHLDAPCPVDSTDPTLVTLNTGTDAIPKVFVYLNTYEGVTEAFWNGGQGASHAQEPLGEVALAGRCWENARVRICRPA